MAGIYRQRHPERMVLYRVLFHHISGFLKAYESRFEREYGYLRPIVEKVVDKYLDCGNPKCGFARIKCSDCGREKLLMFSCKTRGFCPSCHAKRREEWGEWMREELILDAPHRQVVFTIPSACEILQGDHTQRDHTRYYCCDTVIWKQDKFSSALAFSGYRGWGR